MNKNLIVSIDKELIAIGRTGVIQGKGHLVNSYPVYSSEAYELYNEKRISKYSKADVISLFKGLVIAEKELNWHCGSTTPAAHLYQYISSRHFDRNNELATWAFEYSDNEYVPFGFRRHGERTANEYLQWCEDYNNRLIQEKLDSENRKIKKAVRAQEIKKLKEAKDGRNRELYQKIFNMSPHQQVEYIINDNQHNFLFYMPVINHLLNTCNIDSEIFEPILSKLSNMAPTPFNRRLIKRIKSKQ